MQRYIHTCHAPNFVAPHTRAVHDHIAFDISLITIFGNPINAGDTASVFVDIRNAHTLLDDCAAHPRAFGHGQGDICRITLTVFGQVNTTHYIFQVQVFIAHAYLGRCDFFNFNAKRTGHRGTAA